MELKNEILAVVIALLVVGSLGAGYILGVNNRQSVTRTVILTEHTSTYSSAVSPTGLRLELWLNATSFPEGSGVTAQIHLVNTLDKNVTAIPVYSSNFTISKWNGYDFFCGSGGAWGVVGFALLSGHVTPANVSLAGNPLVLAPSAAIGCVTWPNPVSFVWLPDGERAVAYYSSSPPTIGQAELNATTEYCRNLAVQSTICGELNHSLFGYWNSTMPFVNSSNATTSSKYFGFFVPGEYTLVAEDVWNQTVYGYFQVQAIAPG